MTWNVDGSSPSAPASPAAVTLHLGAHKTASTHLQKALLAHRDALSSFGCCYLGPDALRKRNARAALGQGKPANIVNRMLGQASQTGQRVLLSDENILGRPHPPFIADGECLYPHAEARVGAFLSGYGIGQVTLALSLRDPLGFLVSAHGHQAMAGRPTLFEDFVNGVAPLALRWSDMIARLLQCTEVTRIILWRFEDYPRIAPKVVSELAGNTHAGAILAADIAPRLTGISAQALQNAQVALADDPARDPKRTVRQHMRRYPKSAQYPALQPFSPACVAHSRGQYDRDWDQLATWPRVTCLTL